MQSYFKGYSAPYFRIAKQKNWHPEEYRTRMEHLNFHFRQNGEHLYAYDEELLRYVLRKVGFTKLKKRSYRPGIDAEFHHPGSLYLQAWK
jgi:hypothetical protein